MRLILLVTGLWNSMNASLHARSLVPQGLQGLALPPPPGVLTKMLNRAELELCAPTGRRGKVLPDFGSSHAIFDRLRCGCFLFTNVTARWQGRR
jgi:hypothetical protein